MKLKNTYGDVIFTCRRRSVKTAVEEAAHNRKSLCGVELSGANLRNLDLQIKYYKGFRHNYVNLKNADLSYADLTGAKLIGCDLESANLHGANLTGVDLTNAYLYRTNLERTIFGQTIIKGTTLEGTDLFQAQGILNIGPIGSRSDLLYAVRHVDGPMIKTGCFWGTLDDFLRNIDRDHSDDKDGEDYLAAAELIRTWA